MFKGLRIDYAENMCRCIGPASTLHVVVFIHGIKHPVVYTLTQFNGLDNLVRFAIDELNRTITPVRDD